MADVEKINGYDIKDASAVHSVTVTQDLTSGTKVGSVSVDGTSTDLYAPTNTNSWRPVQVNGTEVVGSGTSSGSLNLKSGTNVTVSGTVNSGTVTISATDTTYESKAAASGGTAVSLVTTGEKYTWNNKSDLALGSTSTTAAAGNHTHTTSLASGGTSTVDLAANTTYTLTAGGTSVAFKTPPDNNSVTGVKGDSESSYRTGNVNLTAANIGAATSGHTHTTTIAADSGTSALTMSANTKYKLTAGGTTFIFTTPPDNNTNTWRPVQVNGTAIGSSDTLNLKAGSNVSLSNSSGTVTIAATDTTYTSKTAASGGTDVSLVTTGEKYTWNNKSNLAIGTTATTAAAGNHTHNYAGSSSAGGAATSLAGFTNTTTSATAVDSATQNGHVYVTGTSGIYSQSDGACYVQAYSTSWVGQIYQDYRTGQIALRGKNNGTWQSWRKVLDSSNWTTYITSQAAASGGTTVSLVTTGEKYTWNNKSNLAIGTTSTTAAAGNHTHTTSIAASSGTNQITLAASTKYAITAGGTSYVFTTPPNTNTTYSAGTGLSLSSTTFNHSNSVTAGTAGTSSATSGSTLAVPYVTYDAQGHVTASGTHTHTVSGFAASSHNHAASNITSGTLGVARGGTGNTTGKATSVNYQTSAPTANNTDGIKVAVLSSEPSTKYTGWLYIITG